LYQGTASEGFRPGNASMHSDGLYVIIWQYRLRSGVDETFVKVYGPEGTWVQLFRRAKGYLKTQLRKDTADPRRFLTFDFWKSQDAFEEFRKQYQAEYERLDKECDGLTEQEIHVGSFLVGKR